MAAKGLTPPEHGVIDLWLSVGRISAAISERRFSACRLAVKALASWQPMHAIYIRSTRRSDVGVNYQRRRPNQLGKLQMRRPDRSRQPILVRTSCLRGCGPRAAWPLRRIDWTTYLPGCGSYATLLPGCRLAFSRVTRSKLDYVGQPAIPPVSGSHYETGMPASAGTVVQEPQLPRTASVHN